MLILFDIDATLIHTSGAGIKAMIDAGKELFSASFTADGIEFAGRLDPLIMTDMFRLNGVVETPEARASFREGYRKHLERRLADPATVARSLPGVVDLLAHLGRREHVCVGLLTGNFAETGTLKLSRCGLDAERFEIRVWGDESTSDPPRREDLPGVALDRYRERHRRELEPERAVVIGDTPHDIRCARAHRCRVLAVATGSFSVESLAQHAPDRAVADLSATDDIVSWLLNCSV